MKGKYLICEKYNSALLLVQISLQKGIIGGYNQILQNALICAFFTMYSDCDITVKEYDVGYNGWMKNSRYNDFAHSLQLNEYIQNNPEVWFCMIIKEHL